MPVKGISAIMNRLRTNTVMSQLNMTGEERRRKLHLEVFALRDYTR